MRTSLFWSVVRSTLPTSVLMLCCVSCSTPPPANGNLAQSPTFAGWQLAELYDEPVLIEPSPTLSLYGPDGKITGSSGINRFSTELVPTAGGLKMAPIVSTKMAGSPQQMALEQRFFEALGETTGWKMNGSHLELVAGRRVVAHFVTEKRSPPRQTDQQ